MTLKEDLKTLLNTKKHTITSVAKAINVSNATLHLWLNDNYKGNVSHIIFPLHNIIPLYKNIIFDYIFYTSFLIFYQKNVIQNVIY